MASTWARWISEWNAAKIDARFRSLSTPQQLRSQITDHSSHLNSSTIQQFNNSTVQQFNTSTVQHLNSSTIQQFNTSTVQHLNSSTIQQFNNMKKITFLCASIGLVFAFAACEKSDCLCKYYNENEQVIGYDSWDGNDVSANQCQLFESDTTVEVNGTDVIASSVSCSTSW